MKIALFDDHTFVLNTLENYLSKKPDVQIVGTATTKKAAIDLLSTKQADIFISDVLTDEEIGLSMFEEIKAKGYAVKIVVYSSITSEFVKQYLFEYGVLAILHKNESLEKLWETLQLVHLNEKYKDNSQKWETPPQLTPKEQEIARYMAKGLAAKEIAMLTNNSVNTINNQKNHLLLKFHCTNSTELVIKLLQMGYLKV